MYKLKTFNVTTQFFETEEERDAAMKSQADFLMDLFELEPLGPDCNLKIRGSKSWGWDIAKDGIHKEWFYIDKEKEMQINLSNWL